MMEPARDRDLMRAEWMFELAAAGQRFAGNVLDPEPEQLQLAVAALIHEVPRPKTVAERVMLRDRLRILTDAAGRQFHRQFHRYFSSPCGGDAAAGPDTHAHDLGLGVEDVLARWLSDYLSAFEQTHQWPGSVRAARHIRARFDQPLSIDDLARLVACSRGALIRSFAARFGISIAEYQSRCRVRAAFDCLREPGSNVGEIAFAVGYRSRKNFYRALQSRTGLTPSQVRDLDDEEAAHIAAYALTLPRPAADRTILAARLPRIRSLASAARR
jgi:AraC-like DNA-binding protein